MIAQKVSRAVAMTGSAQEVNRTDAPEHQAAAVASDSIGAGLIRDRIRCSPSAEGSMDSAAACSARRSTSS
jgi:hypothetical protein